MNDLLVIGGGPAGATCARRAALKGLDVTLIEKQLYPRPKPCGGALSPRVVSALDFDISHLIKNKFSSVKVHRPSGKVTTLTRDNLEAHLIQRIDFDSHLIDKAREAGAEIVTENEIVGIEQLRSGVRALGVGDSYKARFLVGADGVNGISAEQLGIRRRWSPDNVAVCINAEVKLDSGQESPNSFIDIFYGFVEWGYGWFFPKADGANIGLGCRMDKAEGLRDKWGLFLSELAKAKEIPSDISATTSARVPFGGLPGRIIGRRSMLIGDAAGLGSPVSGEGISFAIESGIIAADVAVEAVQTKTPTHIVEYDRRMKNSLLNELKGLRYLAEILYKSESNLEAICDILDSDQILREYFTDIFVRITPFSKLKYKIAKRLLTKHPRKAIKLGL
jgi:geranylgeranyl reductase family protein